MTSVKVLFNQNRCGLRFFNKNTQLDTRKYNIQMLQIKTFVESYLVIYCSEYASGVRNLYCQGDSKMMIYLKSNPRKCRLLKEFGRL